MKKFKDFVNEEMTLWKYNPRSGLWSSERKVTDATKDEWMKIFKKDDPNASFVVSKKKPSRKPTTNEDTTTANVVGTGDDAADWYYNKKKRKPVTKHYIEIGGKIKKQVVR